MGAEDLPPGLRMTHPAMIDRDGDPKFRGHNTKFLISPFFPWTSLGPVFLFPGIPDNSQIPKFSKAGALIVDFMNAIS